MTTPSCDCFIARHPKAAEIDAALRAGDSPREVERSFGVGKSAVYQHRGHLGITERPARKAPGVPLAAPQASPEPEPATAAPPAPTEPAEGSERPADIPRGQVSAADSRVSVDKAPLSTDAAGSSRARPEGSEITRRAYDGAVSAAMGLIGEGRWRVTHVDGVAARFGISTDRARRAFQEAARHLRLNMGDFAEKQAVSAAYTAQHRDQCRAREESTRKLADDWRRREREAVEAADRAGGEDERMARLGDAARFGMTASKYGMEAEKWSAQTLNAQRHLDDILCVKVPPATVHATQINLGGDGLALLEKFGGLLAERFRDRPDVLREIEAAAAAVETGGGDIIDATGEAA